MNSLWILGGNLVWALMAMTPIRKPHFAYKMEKRDWGLYWNLCFKLETGCTENRWRGVLLMWSRPPTHNSPYLLQKWESPDACGFFMLYYLSVSLSPSLPLPSRISTFKNNMTLHFPPSHILISSGTNNKYTLLHVFFNILENLFIRLSFCMHVCVYTHMQAQFNTLY